jgi:hypothetical protein
MPEASLTVGDSVTILPGYPAVVAMTMSPPVQPPLRGQVIDGAVTSYTVTVKVQAATLLLLSVAVQRPHFVPRV